MLEYTGVNVNLIILDGSNSGSDTDGSRTDEVECDIGTDESGTDGKGTDSKETDERGTDDGLNEEVDDAGSDERGTDNNGKLIFDELICLELNIDADGVNIFDWFILDFGVVIDISYVVFEFSNLIPESVISMIHPYLPIIEFPIKISFEIKWLIIFFK